MHMMLLAVSWHLKMAQPEMEGDEYGTLPTQSLVGTLNAKGVQPLAAQLIPVGCRSPQRISIRHARALTSRGTRQSDDSAKRLGSCRCKEAHEANSWAADCSQKLVGLTAAAAAASCGLLT